MEHDDDKGEHANADGGGAASMGDAHVQDTDSALTARLTLLDRLENIERVVKRLLDHNGEMYPGAVDDARTLTPGFWDGMQG